MSAARRTLAATALGLASLLPIALGGVAFASGPTDVVAQANPPPHGGPHGPRPPVQVGPGHVQSASGEPREHAEHAEHAEHDGTPKDVNWLDFSNTDQPPYLAALINFGILIFIYVYFGKTPLAAALKNRRLEVSKQIDEAQKIKREAEARSKQYASKLDDLGMELETTRVALASAGAGEKARIVREAEEKAARMEKDAALLVEQERKQMQADLQRETVESGLAAAAELLRTKLTLADQERVAEEFLATLVPGKTSTASSGSAGGAS